MQINHSINIQYEKAANKCTKLHLLMISILGIVFFGGCVTKMPEKNSLYDTLMTQARGCGVSEQEAQLDALRELSAKISSQVKSKFTKDEKIVKNNAEVNVESLKVDFVESSSAFKSISPKFIDLEKTFKLFSDNQYCITTLIDNDLLERYKKFGQDRLHSIMTKLKYYSGKVSHNSKHKFIKNFQQDNVILIDDFHQSHYIVKMLTGDSIYEFGGGLLTEEFYDQHLNSVPYVKIKTLSDDYKYNEDAVFEIEASDESKYLNVIWKINGVEVGNDQRIIKNFVLPPKKGLSYKIEVTVKDESGYVGYDSIEYNPENKPPYACFELEKYNFNKNEPIIFESCASDPEGNIKKITYALIDVNKNFSWKFNNNYRMNRVGAYKLMQTVEDEIGAVSTVEKYIRIDKPEVFSLNKNTHLRDIVKILGRPKQKIEIGVVSKLGWMGGLITDFTGVEPDEAWEYDDYYVFTEGGKLKCIIYHDLYERESCQYFFDKGYKLPLASY